MAFRLGIQITTLFQFLLLIIASMASKIAVVTGGNKGIGYEIVGKLNTLISLCIDSSMA